MVQDLEIGRMSRDGIEKSGLQDWVLFGSPNNRIQQAIMRHENREIAHSLTIRQVTGDILVERDVMVIKSHL